MNVIFFFLWSHCAGVKTAGLCWFLTRKTDGSQIEYYDVHIEICWANTFLHKQTCPVYVCEGGGGGSNLFLQCFGVGARGQPSLYCSLDCLNVCQPTKRVFFCFFFTPKRESMHHMKPADAEYYWQAAMGDAEKKRFRQAVAQTGWWHTTECV